MVRGIPSYNIIHPSTPIVTTIFTYVYCKYYIILFKI